MQDLAGRACASIGSFCNLLEWELKRFKETRCCRLVEQIRDWEANIVRQFHVVKGDWMLHRMHLAHTADLVVNIDDLSPIRQIKAWHQVYCSSASITK